MSNSSSGSCTRFKQNAWKKELCSNCYRPKEEHQPQERVKPPKLYIPLKAPSQGILNLGGKNRSSISPTKSSIKKKSVRFTKEESEIIGYGGDDSDEDDDDDDDDYDEDDDDSSTNSSGYDADDYGTICEEERALERLTKSNTDFNSILSNLSTDGISIGTAVPQHQPLLLGAKQHKQTLQVSIQPFGSPSTTITSNSIAASRKSHLHKLLEDEQPKQSSLLLLGSSPDENDDPLFRQSQQQQPINNQGQKDLKKTEQQQQQQEVPIKTIFIETGKKEERGNPEGRKTHIQRGNVITKSHEQVKNKLYIQNIAQKEKRNSLLQDKTNESEDLKTLIIRTNSPDLEEQKNSRNLEDSQLRKEKKEETSVSTSVVVQPTKLKIENEQVTVKVLKLLNGEDGPAESREMAGEPDGKADSDEPETPLTPPPRASFLHREAIQQHHVPPPITSSTPSPLTSPHHSPSSTNATTTPTTPTSPLSLVLSPSIETKYSSPQHSPSAISPSLPSTPQPYSEQSSSSGSNSPNNEIPTSPGLLLARCKRPAPKPPTPDLQQSPPPLPPPPPPEPVPRLRRGSSETILTTVVMATTPGGTVSEKKKTRVRQTLRKLLRLGREDESNGKDEENHQQNHQLNQTHQSRPRPHIIHPLDLNKSGVQVLPPLSVTTDKASPDSSNPPITPAYSSARPTKPPPPPRSESLNLMERLRPSPNSENNVYANLGEGRCGITPVKPQRTGSLRDQASSTPTIIKQTNMQIASSSVQAQLESKHCTLVQHTDTDHVYECVGVSSAPECDMERQRTSLQYSSAGSETESDIYYPYVTFQNGECKTKIKKRERGVVHSTLEENYGAVVVANYEALSHLLVQVKTRKPTLCSELEMYVRSPCWSSFSCNTEHILRFDSITFLTGSINKNCNDVCLAIKDDQDVNLPADLQPFITFSDIIPSGILKDQTDLTKHNISVLGMLKLERLKDYAEKLERSAEGVREGVLVLLQAVEHMVVNDTKYYDPANFIIYFRHGEPTPRATYVPSNKKTEDTSIDINETLQTLCNRLLNDLPLSKIISNTKSIRDIRNLLQTWLWGPTVSLAPQALRRWLDLERATFLHSIVCNNITNLQDLARDLHLKFLVETDIQEIATATTYFIEAANNNSGGPSMTNIEQSEIV